MIDDMPNTLVNKLIVMHLNDIHLDQAITPPSSVRDELFEKVFPPRRVDALLRGFPDSNSQAVVVADVDGIIEWVSPAFSRMCGYSLAELRGNKAGKMLQGAETDPRAVETFRSSIREKKSVTVQLANYAKSSKRYDVEIQLFPTFSEDGSCNGFAALEKGL